jgi:hypothetical protein
MRTSDLNQPITAKSLNESLFNKFNVKINFDKYTREQLEDARNKYRSKLFAQEAQANFNDLLSNESYQRDKFVLDVLNTRIKEMLGEGIANIERQIREAKLPMKTVNGKKVPAFAADGKGKNDLTKNKKTTEGKKIDQNKDGKNDWEDIKIARMKASGAISKDKKVKETTKFDHSQYDGDREEPAGSKSKPTPKGELGKALRKKLGEPEKKDSKVKEDMKDGETKTSSTGGTITKTKTGLKHTAGKNYGAMKQPFDQGDDADHKTKKAKKVKESRNVIAESIAHFIAEDEEGKAKSITAAADMVNDFTSWMQRVGNYQTKSMIELADNIRANFGMQEAETFKQSVGSALEGALTSLTQAREEINNAVAVLAGEAPAEEPMGMDSDVGGDVGDIGSDMEIEPGAGDDMNAGGDEFAASDAAAGGPETTGRMKRESIERGNRLMKILGN